MRRNIKARTLITTACLMPGMVHGTQITNPGFETGDFTGWSVLIGLPTTAVDNTFGLPPLVGQRSALVLFQVGDLAFFCNPWHPSCSGYPPVQTPLNPPSGPPMPNPLTYTDNEALYNSPGFFPAAGCGPNIVTRGIGITFAAASQQRIAFDLQLLTQQAPFCFYSAAVLKDVNLPTLPEGSPLPPGLVGLGTFSGDFSIGNAPPSGQPVGNGIPGTGFDLATPPHTYSIEIPYDGTWQLFIVGGAFGEGSYHPYAVGALVDNLRLVPEPGTLALLSLGLLGLGVTRRKA